MGRHRTESLRVLGPYYDTSKGTWRLTVVNPFELNAKGKPTRVQQSFENKADALQARADALGEIKAGQETSVDQTIALYEEQHLLKVKKNTPESIRNTLYRLRMFFGPILPLPVGAVDDKITKQLRTGTYKTIPGQLKPQQVTLGLASRKLIKTGAPPTPTSQLNILAEVRTFVQWCVAEGRMRRNPMAWFNPKMEPPREHGRLGNSKLTLPQAQTMALLTFDLAAREMGQSDLGIRAAAVALTLATALRASSVVKLNVSSIEQRAGMGAVDSEGKPAPQPWVVKYRRVKKRSDAKMVEVPLEQPFEEILLPFIAGRGPDEPLFTTTKPRGSRVGSSRLTDQQADEIRALAGTHSVAVLARRFGVCWTAASRVIKGETHGDVDQERKRPRRDWLRDSVAKMCELAGVPPETAHAIRGQIASKHAARGDLGMAQWLLGHDRASTTTQSYASAESVSLGKQRNFLLALQGGRK
jgi:site-specific recombinase XerD